MKASHCLLLALWLWGISGVAIHAAAPLDALERFSVATQSLRADFEQVTYDTDGFLIERSQGALHFSHPNQFRWAYDEPIAEMMIGDGAFLWHYDPGLAQVTRQPQPDPIHSPLLVFSDFDQLKVRYEIEEEPSSGELVFVPYDSSSPIAEARVMLAESARTLVIEWVDNFDQLSRVTLTNIDQNLPLDEALFNFVPPAGVDVLEGF